MIMVKLRRLFLKKWKTEVVLVAMEIKSKQVTSRRRNLVQWWGVGGGQIKANPEVTSVDSYLGRGLDISNNVCAFWGEKPGK